MFPGSRKIALKRLYGLERKLSSDTKLRSLYNDFMSDYLSSEHMSVASSFGQYFIPHHSVCKDEDGNIKIRLVFDASAN